MNKNSNKRSKRLAMAKVEKHIVSYQAEGFVWMAIFTVVFGLLLSIIGNIMFSSVIRIRDLTLFSPVISLFFAMYLMHNRIKCDIIQKSKQIQQKNKRSAQNGTE